MQTAIMINERTARLVAAHIGSRPEIIAASARRHFERGQMLGYVIGVQSDREPFHHITESELEAYYA